MYNPKHLCLYFVFMLAVLLISPSLIIAATIIIPPNPPGDLNGTADDDTIIIKGTGIVSGDVDGLGGSNSIEIQSGGQVTGQVTGGQETAFNTVTNHGIVGEFIFGSYNGGVSNFGGGNTIMNHGIVGWSIYGSDNYGTSSYGGDNIITNHGTILGSIYGSYNRGSSSYGGDNTITNHGTVYLFIVGSYNILLSGYGGDHTITNYDRVGTFIMGSYNIGASSHGGDNTIINYGTVDFVIYGSANSGSSSYGGDNTITNYGMVSREIYGSYNEGSSSYGGDNTIINYGTVSQYIYGSYNRQLSSYGGDNTITNYGTVDLHIYGSYNQGSSSSGGGNTITNHGTIGNSIWGSYNQQFSSYGGDNAITNYGTVNGYNYGSYNVGSSSYGGDNTITNHGSTSGILGSFNGGSSSYGGDNTITNYGTVNNFIYGSYNQGSSSSGGDNTITNHGTVSDSIYGSKNEGTPSFGGDNTITNRGMIEGDIYGSYNLGTSSYGGGNTIINYGTVMGSVAGVSGSSTATSMAGNSISNYGWVGGDIYGGDVDDQIINRGHVGGDIDGGTGDDTVTMQSGPESVVGNIDGGADTDTIIYSGGTWIQNHPKVINFENFGIDATHHLTLSGDWDIGSRTAYVNGGILDIPDSLIAGGLEINSGTTNVYGMATINGLTDVDGRLNVFSGGVFTTQRLEIGGSGIVDIDGLLRADHTRNFGRLFVNGTLDSRLYNYGFLGGSGIILGNVSNFGTVSPGNSIGTLSIHGSYSHSPGALYIAEISSTGRSDLLDISGRATLKGGTVRTHLPRGLYTDGYDWTILQADGGISGTFAQIDGQPVSATLSLDLDYTATSVDLVVERKPYEEFGNNKGSQAVGTGLDMLVPLAMGAGDDMELFLTSLDFDHTAKQISQVLDELNPEVYTAFNASAKTSSSHFADGMRKRASQFNELKQLGLSTNDGSKTMAEGQGQNLGDDPYQRNWQLWGRGFGGKSDFSKSGYQPFSSSTAGVIIGGDGQVFADMRLGLALGSSKSEFDFEGEDDGEQKSILAGVYGDYHRNSILIDFSLNHGWHNGDAVRDINLPTVHYQLGAEPDATTIQAHLGGAYLFNATKWLFGPVAALDYIRVSGDDFSEQSGSPVDLDITVNGEDHIISKLGGKLSGLIMMGDTAINPRFELSWLHDFNRDENYLDAAFQGYENNSFRVYGSGVPQDLLNIEAGITAQIKEQFAAFLELSGNVADDYSDYLVSIGAEWSF